MPDRLRRCPRPRDGVVEGTGGDRLQRVMRRQRPRAGASSGWAETVGTPSSAETCTPPARARRLDFVPRGGEGTASQGAARRARRAGRRPPVRSAAPVPAGRCVPRPTGVRRSPDGHERRKPADGSCRAPGRRGASSADTDVAGQAATHRTPNGRTAVAPEGGVGHAGVHRRAPWSTSSRGMSETGECAVRRRRRVSDATSQAISHGGDRRVGGVRAMLVVAYQARAAALSRCRRSAPAAR